MENFNPSVNGQDVNWDFDACEFSLATPKVMWYMSTPSKMPRKQQLQQLTLAVRCEPEPNSPIPPKGGMVSVHPLPSRGGGSRPPIQGAGHT